MYINKCIHIRPTLCLTSQTKHTFSLTHKLNCTCFSSSKYANVCMRFCPILCLPFFFVLLSKFAYALTFIHSYTYGHTRVRILWESSFLGQRTWKEKIFFLNQYLTRLRTHYQLCKRLGAHEKIKYHIPNHGGEKIVNLLHQLFTDKTI